MKVEKYSPHTGVSIIVPLEPIANALPVSYADPPTFLNLVPLKGEPINYKNIYINFGERIIIRTEHNLLMGNGNLKNLK